MRLDVYLVENKIYDIRTRAARAIKEGCVQVNGKVATKASEDVSFENDSIICREDPVPYVGRGALKLQFALEKYEIDVNGLKAVDIGASTGGFTEVLLKNGIKSVACVDVGHGQLAEKIRSDPRTDVYERIDVRNFDVNEGRYDIAVTDVSFISIKLIIPHIYRLIKENGLAVMLIKPQFEAGRKNLNKKGVVKNDSLGVKIASEVAAFAVNMGFEVVGLCESPVKGGEGNREFICVCRRKTKIDV